MKEMNFEEFTKLVMEEIEKWLPESFGNSEVSLNVSNKNNGMKITGLLIKRTGSAIAPVIYLDGFFKQYQEGTSMEDIMQKIARLRVDHDQVDGIDVSMISDFDMCKDKIIPRLVNSKWNEDVLANRPYVEVSDLSVIFVVDMGTNENGSMSIPITNDIMNRWNVTVEDLYDVAMFNMEREDDGLFVPISVMLMGMMGVDATGNPSVETDDTLFVLTNKSKVLGASMLLSKKMMNKVVEKVGSDFFIIPSSVHEVLIIPNNPGLSVQTLEEIIHDVNTSQVDLPDRLGDHVYRYSKNGLHVA